MDSAIGNSEQSCCGHAKITEQHSDDRFSNLPFDMLCHILSFVDTREAVGTSLLSRNWRYIWSSVPRLNFNYKCFCTTEQLKDLNICDCFSKFCEFVMRTLIIRKTHPIHAMHFSWDYFGAVEVKLLLHLCATRNVQELDIFATSHNQRSLPPAFGRFLTGTLPNQDGLVDLSLTPFGNLKILRLVRVWFNNDFFTEKLFCDCGILEDLSLEYCCFRTIPHLNISSHKLRNLTFVNMGPANNFSCECNLRLSLKVNAPNLLSFCYIGPAISVSQFSNMSCLDHALIQVPNQSCLWSPCSGLAIMICHFLHAKGLTLSAAFVRYFYPACSWVLRGAYLFDRLTVLRVELVCKPDHVEGFIHLLRISPELRVLGIKFVKCRGRSAWKSREVDVPCFSRHFKEIEITKFLDSACSMEVIKFFLLNAKSLEKIRIIQKKEVDAQKFYALQAVPLASEAVSVSFKRSASGGKDLLRFMYKKCRVDLWQWMQENKSKPSGRMRYEAVKSGCSLGKRGRSYMWHLIARKKLKCSV